MSEIILTILKPHLITIGVWTGRCVLFSILLSGLFFVYGLASLVLGINKGVFKRKLFSFSPIIFGVGCGLLFFVLPPVVDKALNPISIARTRLPSIDKETKELYKTLWISDMHSDSLLWGRNLLEKSSRGHVDIPRMLESNIAMQMFTIVTRAPATMNMESNEEPSLFSDIITLVTIMNRWGMGPTFSPAKRVLYLAGKFEEIVRSSSKSFYGIRTRKDLEDFDNLFAKSHNITSGMLGIEGLHCIESDINNLKVFYDVGIRMMGIAHFFDNEVGGSAHGSVKGGLTEFGKQVVAEMNRLGIVVDLSHASTKVVDDVINLSTKPILVSHVGVKAICPGPRNLDDDRIKRIAQKDGLLCVAFFRPAICGDDDLASIVATIKHIKNLVGIRHVALGSDFDGAVQTPFDITGIPYIAQALRDEKFSEEEIAAVLGNNVKAFWLKNLPQ